MGAISLWAGAPGCGKSRLAIAVAAKVASRNSPILFIQNETTLPQFKQWATAQSPDDRHFFVCNSNSIDEILQAIRTICPSLVIVDSISMLEGIERPQRAKQAITKLQGLAKQIQSHVILIGHLNAKGQVKGGTTLPHLVDIVCHLERGSILDWLWLEIPSKHRYGPTGRSAAFRHLNNGLEPTCIFDDEHGFHQVHLDFKTGQEKRILPERDNTDDLDDGMVTTLKKAITRFLF